MADPRDIRSVIESAEQAAAEGNPVRAEQFLLQAAGLQEATLGPRHPDLANTLNNLGVLYENTERPAEAEECYRRAYAIVRAVLDPEHPFVETSGRNLRDFCEARGRPVEMTEAPAVESARAGSAQAMAGAQGTGGAQATARAQGTGGAQATANTQATGGAPARAGAPAAANTQAANTQATGGAQATARPEATSDARATVDAPLPPRSEPRAAGASTGPATGRPRPSPLDDAPPRIGAADAWSAEEAPASSRSRRGLVLAAVAAVVLVAVALLALRAWRSGPQVGAGFAADETAGLLPPAGAPAGSPAPASPAATSPPPAPLPEPAPRPRALEPPAAARTPPAAATRPAGATAAGALPAVAESSVCRTLATGGGRPWRCDPVTTSGPGTFFFYTRLKAATDTTVQHRWYHGDRLHHSADLRIRANPGAGYRTYSRITVTSRNPGDWRTEVRAADGTVLAETRFTVQ